MNGYVLLLENITADIKSHEDKVPMLRTPDRGCRIRAGSSRAALKLS